MQSIRKGGAHTFIGVSTAFSYSGLSGRLRESGIRADVIRADFRVVQADFPNSGLLGPAVGSVFQRPYAKLVREAVLPLGFQLFRREAVVGFAQTVHGVGVRIVEQPFACQEVPHHHHGGGDELADVGADQVFGALRHVGIMVHAIRGDPDNGVVHEQADQRANHENEDFHPAGHVVTVLEHQFHAGNVVENQGNNERDGCGELIRKYKSCIILYFQSEARAFYDLIPAIIFSVSFCNHRACRDFLHLVGIGVWRCFVKISPVMLSVSGELAE